MPFGLDESWVASPPDVRGAGDQIQTGSFARAMAGGPSWDDDMSGFQPDTGLQRLVTDVGTGSDPGSGMNVDPKLNARLDDWRNLFNWRHSPTPWLLVGLLVAVGFINLRVNTKVGPAHGDFGIG